MYYKLCCLVLSLLLAGCSFSIIKPSSNGDVVPNATKMSENANVIKFTPNNISLQTIFDTDHTWTGTLSAQKKTSLIATGDVIPARSVNFKTNQYGDWKWAFSKTVDILKSADITFADLEAPLLKDCPITNEGMIFCSDSKHIEGLKYAGIDIVSTANNHYGNHGIEGINESNDLLTLNDIIIIQNNKIKPITINDTSFLFLNYNEIGHEEEGLDWADNEKIVTEIKAADDTADVVVVAYHWGVEYTTEITDRQKELAHLAIDNGADLIIGNHPHWIQPLEMYKGKLIMYAHGNFVFDQMWSQETREGVIGRYTFYDKDLVDVEYLPVQIDDYGQPHFMSGDQSAKILNNLYNISKLYASRVIIPNS